MDLTTAMDARRTVSRTKLNDDMRQHNADGRQSELICPFCSRVFESNKQTTRHIRYCRTKAKNGVSTRQKSCVACIKAKTRCDMASPGCSRCTGKGCSCIYRSNYPPAGSKAQSISVVQPAPAPVFEDVEATPSCNEVLRNDVFERPGLNDSPMNISDIIETPQYDFGIMGNIFHQSIPTNTRADLELNQDPMNADEAMFSDGMLNLTSSDCPAWTYRIFLGSYYVMSLSPSFTPLDAKAILEKRKLEAGPRGSSLARAYCMTVLRSYPEMLCRNDGTLPPFIHLQHQPSSVETDSRYANDWAVALPEPLAICSSIMKMYVMRSAENLAFIWRTIQAESRRIENEYQFYDAWTTLASIQAMIIYIILGLLGDNSNYVADGKILMPILGLAKKMADRYRPIGWMCNGEVQQDQIPAWEEWALAESRRRTAIVIGIIIHIFNIEHGNGLPQCGGFAELSLPCSKTLWQASDLATWETEYRKQYVRESNSGRSFKVIPTYGDLLPDLQDQNDSTSTSRIGCLGQWLSNMDDLGTLVTMAVSIL